MTKGEFKLWGQRYNPSLPAKINIKVVCTRAYLIGKDEMANLEENRDVSFNIS